MRPPLPTWSENHKWRKYSLSTTTPSGINKVKLTITEFSSHDNTWWLEEERWGNDLSLMNSWVSLLCQSVTSKSFDESSWFFIGVKYFDCNHKCRLKSVFVPKSIHYGGPINWAYDLLPIGPSLWKRGQSSAFPPSP